jgi:hypothetical protein
MVTVGLVLILIVIAALVYVVGYQMFTCPFMWMYYAVCGTMGLLFDLAALTVSAIVDANR